MARADGYSKAAAVANPRAEMGCLTRALPSVHSSTGRFGAQLYLPIYTACIRILSTSMYSNAAQSVAVVLGLTIVVHYYQLAVYRDSCRSKFHGAVLGKLRKVAEMCSSLDSKKLLEAIAGAKCH